METLRNIPKNIREIRPTLMMSVPALSKAFKKNIEGAVRAKGETAWRMFSFFVQVAYKYNGGWHNRGKGWRMLLKPLMALGDKLIFNAVKENFGGRLAHFIGGGALLGFATGGTASVPGITLLSSPEYAVSECAKIEVVILEILNKVQNDKDAAFLVLKRFEDSIGALSEYMNDLNPKIKKEKTEIQKLKKSILYMKNTVEYIRKKYNA